MLQQHDIDQYGLPRDEELKEVTVTLTKKCLLNTNRTSVISMKVKTRMVRHQPESRQFISYTHPAETDGSVTMTEVIRVVSRVNDQREQNDQNEHQPLRDKYQKIPKIKFQANMLRMKTVPAAN